MLLGSLPECNLASYFSRKSILIISENSPGLEGDGEDGIFFGHDRASNPSGIKYPVRESPHFDQ